LSWPKSGNPPYPTGYGSALEDVCKENETAQSAMAAANKWTNSPPPFVRYVRLLPRNFSVQQQLSATVGRRSQCRKVGHSCQLLRHCVLANVTAHCSEQKGK
jgi:hypothetical protein